MSLRVGFITSTIASIRGRGVKYWPAPDFFSLGVLLQEAFVEIARGPLDVASYQSSLSSSSTRRVKVAGFLMNELALAKISCDQHRAVAAQMDQHILVELEPIRRRLALEIVPAKALRVADPRCRSLWPSSGTADK